MLLRASQKILVYVSRKYANSVSRQHLIDALGCLPPVEAFDFSWKGKTEQVLCRERNRFDEVHEQSAKEIK